MMVFMVMSSKPFSNPPNLEGHHLLAINCVFKIFTSTFHTWR